MRKNKFKPVPLHYRSKKAIDNYTDDDWKPPADEFWSKHNYGVGCVTGPPGPIDIDLDCSEAIHFARYFLPKTPAVFGRKSKRSSHYLYKVTASEFKYKALQDVKTGISIIEARGGTGSHQTVFPGSLHQDTGEPIEWEQGVDPVVPEVDAEFLMRQVNKISAATHLVRYHVWSAGRHNDMVKHLSGTCWRLEWPLDETEQLIQSLMDFDGDRDRSRLPTVRLTYKKAANGDPVSGSGKLREEIKDRELSSEILKLLGAQTTVIIDEYNEHHATVRIGSKFRVVSFDVPISEPPMFMAKTDFLDWKSNDLTTIDDKPVAKAKIWLASRERRAYANLDFLPGQDAPPGVLNLWNGWDVQPSKEGSCDAWLELLRDVICGGDDQLNTWMLNWFCNILKDPQNKSMTAPVLLGKQGVGKTVLLEYFGIILGKGFMSVTQAEQIHGKHNAHLQHLLLLHSEEAVFGGDRKHLSVLKSMITDRYQLIEPKNIGVYKVRNYMRLVFTSNELRAAPTESGDRRFTVLDSGDRIASDKLIKAVLKERDSSGPARLFQFFNDFSYDPAIPRVNVKNRALVEMKAQNWDPVQTWWHDTLEQGTLLPDDLRRWSRTTDEMNKDWPPEVSSRALYVSLVMYWHANRCYGTPPSDTLLSFRLNKFLGIELERKQLWGYEKPTRQEHEPPLHPLITQLSERQSTITNMPTLEQCRQAFERHVGQAIRWVDADVLPFKPVHRRF